MNQDDFGDIKIDLGNPNAKGYGGAGRSDQGATRLDQGGPTSYVEEHPRPPGARPTGFFACFNIEFYQPFFDVTTDEVKERIVTTIDPRRNNFFDILQGKPDLYGPFWIYTTLIFALAAAGNFSGFLASLSDEKSFQSHFDFVPIATGVIYGFGIVVPVVFTFLLRLFGSKVSYIDTVCIYGYSTFILIPVLLLAIIPYSIVQWIVLMYGLGSSTWFLLNNYGHELGKYVGNQRYVLLGFIGASQFILLLVFKLKFFDSIYGKSD